MICRRPPDESQPRGPRLETRLEAEYPKVRGRPGLMHIEHSNGGGAGNPLMTIANDVGYIVGGHSFTQVTPCMAANGGLKQSGPPGGLIRLHKASAFKG
jgi:hypothetical protein